MALANTLAYYETATITTVKSFKVQTDESSTILPPILNFRQFWRENFNEAPNAKFFFESTIR